jgi:predicted nucleotide-binding protein (sugar kinase/HSP70/actin superfamily)
MNKVCAAGTGSFLEEQAEKLGIRIEEEFGRLALAAPRPARLGDRCTVFMESDLNSHQQKGTGKEDLVGGLAYSIVLNYIQKVVGAKRVGERIFFQGGVANNPAVVAAFQQVTGKRITVPPHFDVTGAIGAAMLARKAVAQNGGRTEFKGFQVSQTPYALSCFTCHGCENQCEIRKVKIQGEKQALHYGGRCEKWETPKHKHEKEARKRGIPNLFERRLELLSGGYREKDPREVAQAAAAGRPSIGIPRGLMIFYQSFPYWRAFFEKLGFPVVLSRPSDRPLVTQSLGMLVAETCFPVEVMHGHIQDLLDKGVDYIFAPFIVDNAAEKGNPTVNYNCPWIQAYPFMIRGSLKGTPEEGRFLIPTLHFRYSRKMLLSELAAFMGERFGISAREVRRAAAAAQQAQAHFEGALREEGRRLLAELPPDKVAAVILGRPYNTGDPELNLSLVAKLIDLGVLPIPLDFLPLELEGIYRDYDMMYWPNGQKLLAAARMVAGDRRLHAVYLTNFRCGPDSFLAHYVREEMRGKPYLQLEVDEHSADAGMITRCEAFLDSLRGEAAAPPPRRQPPPVAIFRASPSRERKLYFPYMADGGYLLAAASRACGVDADVLPMQGERDLELGRQYTSSRECFPMICTTGSFLRKLEEPGLDPGRVSFFMPSHAGPCRFGQYQKFQRIIMERIGYGDVEIVSPNNRNSYADFSRGQGVKFRLLAWKGLVAAEMLEKMRQQRKPYEVVEGETERIYQKYLRALERSIEAGARDTRELLLEAGRAFRAIPLRAGARKPVVAVVGEIFMRDNPFCSGFLRERLEQLGAETWMAPVREWIALSSLRYGQESRWRGELLNVLQAKIQGYFQDRIGRSFEAAAHEAIETERVIPLEDILELCAPYIHRDYVGDPPLAFGAAAALARTRISGVANILPFTCLPGTIVTSISAAFRKDHQDIPWVDIAYDGQEDTGIETRLQAFVHQAREHARRMGYDAPLESTARSGRP